MHVIYTNSLQVYSTSPRPETALSGPISNQHVATAAEAGAYDGECSTGWLCYRLAVIEVHVDDVQPQNSAGDLAVALTTNATLVGTSPYAALKRKRGCRDLASE
jgi:hypothetical protein